jgi:hypothetical protein
MMDGTNHFYNGLTLVDHLRLAILADNGQFTLRQYTIVHSYVVMPSQLLSWRKYVLYGHQFGAPLEIVGQLYTVPTLTGTNQLYALYFGFCCVIGVRIKASS